jgi:hypothetical protein
MIADATTTYASTTISADSNWVFVGDNAGTLWTLTSNRYVAGDSHLAAKEPLPTSQISKDIDCHVSTVKRISSQWRKTQP